MTKTPIIENDYALSPNKLIFSMEELKQRGLSQYRVNKMVKEGKLRKLNKSHYENLSYIGEESDFYYVMAFAPKGVICLMSAALHHGLTLSRPETVDIAISRKGKVLLPEWPPIEIHYYSEERYGEGIELVKEGENSFAIYDKEKTVVDIVSFREKIGIEETKEVLLSYLKGKDRDINKLLRYSEKLGCGKVLKRYLEVLL